MKENYEYFNKAYGLNLYTGKSIIFQGQNGKIVGTRGAHLVIRLDERPLENLIIHPTWNVGYPI